MTYHYHGIDAEESILTKSLPNLGTWALPNLFYIIKTRVTEVSLPKWSLGSPHSDFLFIQLAHSCKNHCDVCPQKKNSLESAGALG